MKKFSLAFVLLTAPLIGHTASTFGNPTSEIRLVGGPATYVHGVVAHRCSSGSTSTSVTTLLTKGDAVGITFATGTYCAVDVLVKWTPYGALETIPVDGIDNTDDLVIVGGAGAVAIELDATDQSAVLN